MLPDSIPEALDPPFAKVNTVAANSPAEQAGLKSGDQIRNFGYVNLANNDGLKKVAECVQGNENVSYATYWLCGSNLLTCPSKIYLSRWPGALGPAHFRSCA